MHKLATTVLAFACLALSSITSAEQVGVKLAKDDLAAFIPGTRAVYVIKGGSTHRWTNEPDGKFVASTDSKSVYLVGVRAFTAPGTWRISDDGKYCIDIGWKRYPESWCRFVYREPSGGYYMTNTDDPNAERHNVELTK